MVESSNKQKFNLIQPKFGMKNYICKDNMHVEPFNRVQNIIQMKNMKGGFVDFYLSQNKWKVMSTHSHDDWSKIFPRRGFWMKQPRTTFTESVIIENKKRPKPAPG